MMRALLAAMIFCLLFVLPAHAKQRQFGYHGHHGHYGRYLMQRHWRHLNRRHVHRLRHFDRPGRHYATRGNLPAPCRVAASMGGPCGCWAAHILLDRVDHVWRGINLWLANDWLRFPHVAAAPGTAAVWPRRHVAPVVAVHNDRTGRPVAITTRESWGMRRVSLAGLVIVQPPSQKRRELIRWPSVVPL
jgi:hypothetical protein